MGFQSTFWTDSLHAPGPASRIGFSDAGDPRIIAAVHRLREKNLSYPIVIGDSTLIRQTEDKAALAPIPDENIASPLNETEINRLAAILVERQKKEGVTLDQARIQLTDTLYRGIAMLLDGQIDGLVAGSLRPTADIVRASIRCVGTRPGYRLVSGHFLIETEDRSTSERTPFLFADCAVVPEPSARTLAAIAIGAAASYRFFTGRPARVALLSFSTRGSAEHPLVDRIREAVAHIRREDPDLLVDGELQLDAAVDPGTAAIKNATDSAVAGRANVFVFPTLEAGNIGYKLVQRFSQARVAGPLLWGLAKPMSDLSRGCTVDEITDTALCVSALARGSV